MKFSRFLLIATLSYTLLLSRWAYAATKNQDFVDSADLSQEEENPLSGSSHRPYVGIPIVTWKIIDKNANEREEVCTQQLAFCTEECGGSNSVSKNFCNTVTMSWDCKCQNHVPATPSYAWPIAVAECVGKENACAEGCRSGATKDLCFKACDRYYRCNQAGSVPSGLKVENESDIPKYNIAVTNNAYTSSSSLSTGSSLVVSYKVILCLLIFRFFC